VARLAAWIAILRRVEASQAFTVTTIFTLALGIGATTMMFGIERTLTDVHVDVANSATLVRRVCFELLAAPQRRHVRIPVHADGGDDAHRIIRKISVGQTRSLPQVFRGGDLFEHEGRDVGARDSRRYQPIADVSTDAIDAPLRPIRED
jgi:hypothetical protein